MKPSCNAVNNKEMNRACELTEGNKKIVYPVLAGRVPRKRNRNAEIEAN